jgi:hypothetical protein
MQTLPSIEEVAIYIAFEGIFGTARGARGFRGELFGASDITEGVCLGVAACDATLLTASGAALGRGGGKGEMEMLLIEAEWAW